MTTLMLCGSLLLAATIGGLYILAEICFGKAFDDLEKRKAALRDNK